MFMPNFLNMGSKLETEVTDRQTDRQHSDLTTLILLASKNNFYSVAPLTNI